MEWMDVVFVVGLLCLGYAVLTSVWLTPRRRLPPGPPRWPVVGNLLSMGTFFPTALEKLSNKYGPIMYVKLGVVPIVVISNAELTEEVLKTHDHIAGARPPPPAAIKHFSYNAKDIVFGNGPMWRRMRMVITQELLTRQRIKQFQGFRAAEAHAMLRGILGDAEKGKVVTFIQYLMHMGYNNVIQMVVGTKPDISIDLESPEGKATAELGRTFRDMIAMMSTANFADFIPFLKPFDFQKIEAKCTAIQKKLDDYFQGLIDHHRQKLKENDSSAGKKAGVDNFVVQLLELRSESASHVRGEAAEPLSDEQMKAVLVDVIIGGTDNIAHATEWVFADVFKKPHLLRRAQEELDSVVGRNRLVNEADLPNLPFIQAIIKESMRMHPTNPMLAPHYATADFELAGYHIPKNTQIFVNSWVIQKDPASWENPHDFNPDRWMIPGAKDVIGRDYDILPFGSGRRICPGMNMAILAIHHNVSQLIHSFIWEPTPEQKWEDLDMSGGGNLIYRKAVAVKAIAKPRLPMSVYGTGRK